MYQMLQFQKFLPEEISPRDTGSQKLIQRILDSMKQNITLPTEVKKKPKQGVRGDIERF